MCVGVLTCAQVCVHDCGMATTTVQRCTCGDPLVYDVPDVERVLKISRSSVYALISTGQLRSYKVLGSRKVDRQAVLDYLNDAAETPATTS